MDIIRVFIGYDPREAIAFHTCVNSLIRLSSAPLSITPLALTNLQGYAETHKDGSNQFIYSRFLVPYLIGYSGSAIYLDGDMIVRDDIAKLWEQRDLTKAVQVVKHEYETKFEEKYLGAKNENYPRKNWSSVMIFNCANYKTRRLSPEFVQEATGKQLHRFEWLDNEDIGQLPKEWNWLPDEYGANQDAKLLHYTAGSPCFHEYACTPMADEWHRERMLTNYSKQM